MKTKIKYYLILILLSIPSTSNAITNTLYISASAAIVESGCTKHEVNNSMTLLGSSAKIPVVRCPDAAGSRFYLYSVYPANAADASWSCAASFTQRRECTTGTPRTKCDSNADCGGGGTCNSAGTAFSTPDACSLKCSPSVYVDGSNMNAGAAGVTPGLYDVTPALNFCTTTDSSIAYAYEANYGATCTEGSISPQTITNGATPCAGALCKDKLMVWACELDAAASNQECQFTGLSCLYTIE